MDLLSDSPHTHVEFYMKTEDVVCQVMRNDLTRGMRD